jgi:hypothetical protein
VGVPWVRVARHLLQGWPNPGDGWQAAVAALPPPLRRIVLAVAELPPPVALAAQGLDPTAAAQLAAAAPLAFLAGEAVAAPMGRARIHTVGQLLDLVDWLDDPERPSLLPRPRVTRGLRGSCAAAVAALPEGWQALATAAALSPPPLCDWVAALQLAAWPTTAGDSQRVWQLSVRAATRMQLGTAEEERRQQWDAFAVAVDVGVTRDDVAALFKLA